MNVEKQNGKSLRHVEGFIGALVKNVDWDRGAVAVQQLTQEEGRNEARRVVSILRVVYHDHVGDRRDWRDSVHRYVYVVERRYEHLQVVTSMYSRWSDVLDDPKCDPDEDWQEFTGLKCEEAAARFALRQVLPATAFEMLQPEQVVRS